MTPRILARAFLSRDGGDCGTGLGSQEAKPDEGTEARRVK